MTPTDRPEREKRDDGIEMKLRGPAVTIEGAFKTGLELKALLGSIAESLGAPEGAAEMWQVTRVDFMCDGCGLRRPDRPRPDEGWTYRDGDDLCPTCSVAANLISGVPLSEQEEPE